jgi:hypothetical protein
MPTKKPTGKKTAKQREGSKNGKTRRMQEQQEALRERINASRHLNKVVEILDKLSDDPEECAEITSQYKIALDGHFKILDKFLPNPKQLDITADIDNKHTVKLIDLTGK